MLKVCIMNFLKYLMQKVNKAEGVSYRERLNPEDVSDNVCDSPNSTNK